MRREQASAASREALRAALRTRQRRTGAPEGHPARPSATLVLLVAGEEGDALLFTRRRESLRTHAGQISFPGGQFAPEDRDAAACALREAAEELGIDPGRVEILGLLDDVVTPTGFLVTPVVGRLDGPVELRPNPDEVAEVIEVPLRELRDPARYRSNGAVSHGGVDYVLHEYHCERCVVWGATARMVHQLLELWPAEGAGPASSK